MDMRSVISWRFLLGLSVALSFALFYLLFIQVDDTHQQAQALVADLSSAVNSAKSKDDKLKFALDSINEEVTRLTSRVALLEAQKDSLSKGISRSSVGQKEKPGAPVLSGNYYMNCGNIVQIDVPGKYTNTKLKYLSEDAKILETGTPGRIVVFPLKRTVQIAVESGGTVVNKVELKNVRNVPAPEFHVYQGGDRIDLEKGAIGRTLSSLSVVAEAEPAFKAAVPKDARYLVKQWELNITRGPSVILRRVCTSESIDLSAERSLLKPGDIVHINATHFVRLTFHDKQEKYAGPDWIVKFPIL